MSDNRKYYYLKLKENYFDDDSMLIRSRLPDSVGGFIFDRRGTPASPLPPQFTA